MAWLDQFENEVEKILSGLKFEIVSMTLPVMNTNDYESHHIINIWDRSGSLIKTYLLAQNSWKNDLEEIRVLKENLLK